MAVTEAKQSEKESAVEDISIQIDSMNVKSAKLREEDAVL